MRFGYRVFPEAIEILEKQGLLERIKSVVEEEGKHYGVVYDDEVKHYVNDTREKGYFNRGVAPGTEREDFMRSVEKLFSERQKRKWKVNNKETDAELEDVLAIGGFLASDILTVEEFWDPKFLGFNSRYELLGIVGAFFRGVNDNRFREGHIWESELDGVVRQINVTGNEHGDFLMLVDDISEYTVLDPLGNEVRYQPDSSTHTKYISGHHSMETMILPILLKYLDQQKIDSKFSTPEAFAKYLEEIEKTPARLGPFGDAGHGSILGSRMGFMFYKQPMVRINSDNKIGEGYVDSVAAYTERHHKYVLDDRNNLVIAESSNGNNKSLVTLTPSDVEEYIHGLFIQASKGLGRTSRAQLVELMQYKFSGTFIEDMNRYDQLK